ncbi:MAG: hypothetical protein BGO29_07255 [Bacteroidales bacterium 36-12]|nr:MAG: hypothetical protein BGO29_07255 [Bacteroidales bacterium 36-12]
MIPFNKPYLTGKETHYLSGCRKQKDFRIEFIFVISILLGICYLYFILINSISVNYHPVWSDEFFYYINTCSFIENNTLKAALTLNGKGSVVFGSDTHGFGYPLLHGVIAKVFGWHNLNFIIFNFVLLTFSIITIWFMKSVRHIHKLWISIYILLFPFFTLYAFTYMQEIVHIFIAILLSACIYNISLVSGKDKKK